MAINHNKTYKDLGRRIEKLRLERGMRQEALAANAEMSHSYYSRIKDGRNISVKTAINLANALDISLAELFDFKR